MYYAHYVLQGCNNLTYWPFKTDGPSYAHWIHSYKHLLPLSCVTASCMKAEEKLVSAQKPWPGKRWHHPHGVTWGIFSPYCTCSLGLHISTGCTHTSVQHSAAQPLLAGSLPPPLVSWQAVSIIAVPAVNCEAQVIVRGVDRHAEMASARGMSVEPQWAHATPSSRADSARFGFCGQCICHNVSTPCSSPLWSTQWWNHSSSYSSPGLEAIHHEARDLHQLFRWEKEWGKGDFWKANTSWFNWKASVLKAAKQISPKMELER